MFWFVLILAIIGIVFYVADKKIKAKFDDKFNPDEWDLPGSVELPAELQLPITSPVATLAPGEKIIYEKKPSALAREYSNFFKALQLAVANEYTVLTNVNAADVLSVVSNSNALVGQVATKNIASKTFSFLLCEKETLGAACVVVFNDNLESTLANACESANLPIARFRAQMNYDVEAIKDVISQATGSKIDPVDKLLLIPETKEISIPHELTSVADTSAKEEIEITDNGIDLKLCPNCSAVMLKRKAKTGANAGKLFWICSTYPTCRGMRAI